MDKNTEGIIIHRERINECLTWWLQTSGTGKSINPTDYFNSITRNNQGETDEIIYLNKTMIKLMEEEE